MIDRHVLPLQRSVLRQPARWIASRGISADQVSLIGFLLGICAVPAIWQEQYTAGLVLILLNRLFDGLDGAVARLVGPTDRGAFLDIALDFAFYSAIPLAFALANPHANALAAATLITSFVGTGSSFLAFSAVAAKRGLSATWYPQKGIYYLGGLAEGAETIGLFIAMCVWPELFAELAYLFSVLCFVTTLTRWHQGWKAFT